MSAIAAIFQNMPEIMLRAIVVGTLVSLCASLLGVTLVLKRYSMIGDGLSHVGFGALTVDNLFDYRPDHYQYNSPFTVGRTYKVGASVDVDKLVNRIRKKNSK